MAKRGQQSSRPKPTPITRGGRKLAEYIDKHFDGNKAAFARAANVERLAVFRVVSGRPKHITVDFAVAASRATKGAVSVEDFVSIDEPPRRNGTDG